MYDGTPQLAINNWVGVRRSGDSPEGFIDAFCQRLIQTFAVKRVPHSGFSQFGCSVRLKTYLHEDYLEMKSLLMHRDYITTSAALSIPHHWQQVIIRNARP